MTIAQALEALYPGAWIHTGHDDYYEVRSVDGDGVFLVHGWGDSAENAVRAAYRNTGRPAPKLDDAQGEAVPMKEPGTLEIAEVHTEKGRIPLTRMVLMSLLSTQRVPPGTTLLLTVPQIIDLLNFPEGDFVPTVEGSLWGHGIIFTLYPTRPKEAP